MIDATPRPRKNTCVIGAFEIAVGSVYATDAIAERFRTGAGFSWGAHDEHVHAGCERFFRPGYLNNLASTWIPALDGVESKLTSGARVADVGCGFGASTLLLAESYPASTIVGSDAHDGSVDAARKRAEDAGLGDRVRFETASATTFDGCYDLVCFFDCLHDMGDPAGACAYAREHLAPGGTLMLIEPFAADELSGNLNPVGAAYFGFSTLLCTPSSLSQDVGAALGAQAGEARLRQLVMDAGFTPLFWAVDRRNMELGTNGFPWTVTTDPLPLIKKLLEAGADPNAVVNTVSQMFGELTEDVAVDLGAGFGCINYQFNLVGSCRGRSQCQTHEREAG